MSTTLLLDIDGVIAPVPPAGGIWNHTPPAMTMHGGAPIPDDIVDWMKTLNPDTTVWSTSWGHHALKISDSIGLKHWDIMLPYPGAHKRKAMVSFLNNNPDIENVILCEDEPYSIPINHRIFHTNPHIGLTRDNMDDINDILAHGTQWSQPVTKPSKISVTHVGTTIPIQGAHSVHLAHVDKALCVIPLSLKEGDKVIVAHSGAVIDPSWWPDDSTVHCHKNPDGTITIKPRRVCGNYSPALVIPFDPNLTV